MAKKIVVAFSGGLDTSWCVPWLAEEESAEVVTVTVDCGGLPDEERQAIEARSRELGAASHVRVDARQRFFDEVIRYLIMGNVLRGHAYPICVGAERTLQASEVARVAKAEGATVIAHGCTAAGNDQVRFEIALRALAPELSILAPIRDLAPSREDEVQFLETRGFAVPAHTADYSVNSGLWGVTIGGRETGDTLESIPESAWVRTRGAFEDPRPPRTVALGFTGGVPSSLDGEALDPVTLIERLDSLAGSYGIGRGIHLGDTILGIKGRVAFEAPAAMTIIPAHRELEKLTLTAVQQRLKDSLAQAYGDLVHEGQHLDPACRDIEALLESSQQSVTGTVTIELSPGRLFVTGVQSPHSLVAASKATYGEAVGEWTPADAAGYAKLRSLPVALAGRARKGE